MKRKTRLLSILLGLLLVTATAVLALSSDARANLARFFSLSPLAPPPPPTALRGLQSSPLGTPVSRPQWTATPTPVATTTPTIPPPPGYPTGEPWPPQITPVTPPPIPTPLPFPTPAFPPAPLGQRPTQLQRVWFPYFPDPASSPQLRAVLVDRQGQRWAQSEQSIDLGLRPGFPGPTLFGLHPSPDWRLLVADVAFGESVRSLIVDPSEGTVRQIYDEATYFYAWHPDSRRVLVSAAEGWLLIDIVSQTYEVVDFRTNRGDQLPVRALAYSPDGKQVAYALIYAPTESNPSGEIEVGVQPAGNGKGVRTSLLRLTGGSMVAEHSLQWSPNGRTLILVAGVQGGEIGCTQLWTIDVVNGTSRLLTTLAKGIQYNLPAVWSPDGHYIAAVRVEGVPGDGTPIGNVYLIDPVSGVERRVTRFSGRRISHLAWSPDGQRLAFTITMGDYGEIWVTDLTGEHQYPIAGPTTPDAPFAWLP